MALPDLAGTADLDDRGITWSDKTSEVATLLTEASAIVREAAGVPILRATSTVTLEGHWDDPWLSLPGQPVADVATVSIDGTAVTDWRLASGQLWRRARWATDDGPAEVEITMTHGLTEVPADIVGLVCSMVAAGLKAMRETADGTGLAARDPSIQSTSESVASYSTSTTYATGQDAGDTAPTAMALPRSTRDALRRRFGGGARVLASR